MPTLHLKRTPEEEAQRRLRKERRKEEKRKRKYAEYLDYASTQTRSTNGKRRQTDQTEDSHRKWASSDDDEEIYGPQPAPSSSQAHDTYNTSHKPDYDAILAQLEEQKFRAKMFEALEDDERLDTVEARLNDFAHIPERWRSGRKEKINRNFFEDKDLLKLDPGNMDDEEYAEWIRAGMYRKTHAEEYAEQQRKNAANAARRAEEKARKAEAIRLEKAAEEERQLRMKEGKARRWLQAREDYHARWKDLLAGPGESEKTDVLLELRFDDIPWPIIAAQRQRKRWKEHEVDGNKSISIDDLTAEAISMFLLPPDLGQGERKEKLRETFLRFHPDKFEGRILKRVGFKDRERVQEAIGQVSRVLNGLLSKQ